MGKRQPHTKSQIGQAGLLLYTGPVSVTRGINDAGWPGCTPSKLQLEFCVICLDTLSESHKYVP